jgi:two-component system sensor histidine kinase UhpB
MVARGVLYERLQRDRDQKGHMLRHLFESDDEERRRLAREIHDETAQVLSALQVLLETLPGPEDRLEEARGYVTRLVEETDRLIHRLRPAVLDDLGLVDAVRTIGMNLLTGAGVEFHLDVVGEEVPLSHPVEAAVYRVFQEAITNILKHAEAERVRARMEFLPDGLVASIEDDGKGMDLSWLDQAVERSRWGLLGMRERVLQFDGRIDFTRSEAGGLRIDIEIPRGTP